MFFLMVVDIHWKHLTEGLLMSAQKNVFYRDIKIIPEFSKYSSFTNPLRILHIKHTCCTNMFHDDLHHIEDCLITDMWLMKPPNYLRIQPVVTTFSTCLHYSPTEDFKSYKKNPKKTNYLHWIVAVLVGLSQDFCVFVVTFLPLIYMV